MFDNLNKKPKNIKFIRLYLIAIKNVSLWTNTHNLIPKNMFQLQKKKKNISKIKTPHPTKKSFL